MVARGLMLQLHRAGLIVLPAKRKSVPNNAARHRAPPLEPALEVAPLECDLAGLGLLEIRQVRRTPEEALFGRLLQTYHYLGIAGRSESMSNIWSMVGVSRSPVWRGRRRLDIWVPETVSSAGLPRSAGPRSTCWLTTRDS